MAPIDLSFELRTGSSCVCIGCHEVMIRFVFAGKTYYQCASTRSKPGLVRQDTEGNFFNECRGTEFRDVLSTLETKVGVS